MTAENALSASGGGPPHYSAFDAIADGVVVHDTDTGAVIDVNEAMQEMHGYTREEFLGREVEDFSSGEPPFVQAEAERRIRKAAEEGPQVFPWLNRRKNGELFWVEVSLRFATLAGEERVVATVRDISDRKAAEEQIKEEKAFTEQVINGLEEVFFVLDAEGFPVQWNDRANEVTGYSDEEIESMRATAFVSEAERPQVIESIEKVLTEGRTRLETEYLTKDGRRIPYEFTGALLKRGDRRLICGTGRDITERKRAEERLRKSETRYRRLFEEAQEGIGISTPEGRLLEVNPAGQEILGYEKEELQEVRLQELYVDPDERRKAREIMAEEGAIRNLEVRLRRKEGEEIVCRLSSKARRGPGGQIESFLTIFRDITEQKRARRALEQSEEKFRALAEESLVGICLIQEGRFRYVNETFAEFYGYDRDELRGQMSVEELVHPQEWPRVREKLQRRLSGEVDALRYETRALTKEGETIYVEVYGRRFEYQGRPAIMGSVLDVTRQRRLEEQLLEIQERERRRIGQELHDGIASQLTGITMIGEGLAGDLAQGKEVRPEDLEEMTELIRESAQQTRLLSRGLNPVQVGKEGLPAALEQLAERTEKQSGLSCRFTVEGEAVDLDGQRAAHLYRIAQEAVSNAAKHAEAEAIEVRLSAENDNLELSVTDDGKGMPGDSERSEGLGLHTMRYRADLIGGRFDIHSKAGEGTRVVCRVQLEREG